MQEFVHVDDAFGDVLPHLRQFGHRVWRGPKERVGVVGVSDTIDTAGAELKKRKVPQWDVDSA
jgi:hypothetical protein